MKHEVTTRPETVPAGTRTLDVYLVAIELARLMREPLGTMRSHNRDIEDQARRALVSVVHNKSRRDGEARIQPKGAGPILLHRPG